MKKTVIFALAAASLSLAGIFMTSSKSAAAGKAPKTLSWASHPGACEADESNDGCTTTYPDKNGAQRCVCN